MSGTAGLRVSHLPRQDLLLRPPAWWQGVLGAVPFGQGAQFPAAEGIPIAPVGLPELGSGQSTCEVWQVPEPLRSGYSGAVHYRAGTQVFSAIDSLGYPNLLRAWNYFAQINETTPFGERYHQFNTARRQAFLRARRMIEGQVPAACALGSAAGSPRGGQSDKRLTPLFN
jgi:hypothetical protein